MNDLLGKIYPVLVRPEFSGNIGMAARAAAVGGLAPLRLVAPHGRVGAPDARAFASGAGAWLRKAKSYKTLSGALRSMRFVVAFTARLREHRGNPVFLPDAVPTILAAAADGPVALLFGTERTGLENAESDRAHLLVRIPTSEEFTSINLAQSVNIVAYALRVAVPSSLPLRRAEPIAKASDIEGLLRALETALARREFFKPGKRDLAMRRIRDFFGRGMPREPEVQLLRGMIRALDQK